MREIIPKRAKNKLGMIGERITQPTDYRLRLAEREGFEPPDPCRSTVFKTAAFDRSAISPKTNAKIQLFR